MKRLTRQELIDITNEACGLLYNSNESDVLAFEENGDCLKPTLLQDKQTHGKTDMFPRGEDPSMHIYMHLAALYGDNDAF